MHFEKATNIKCNTYGHNTIQTQEQNWEYVRKKSERIYGKVTFTTITHREKILINQVILRKIWCLAYMEKPPADRKDIHDFL